MKLSIKEIKGLPREVIFNSWEEKMWKGRSNGIIQEELYLEVYMATQLAESYGEKDTYMSCESVRIPLNRIYRF